MDAGLIAFIAGMIGLLVGVLSMNAVARSERERERSLVSAPTLRDGAAQVLAVIGRAYLVIDEVGGVVQASPGAYAMGLVRGHTVTSPELASMIRTVRHRGIFAEQSFEIDRGESEALVLDVRVASLGDEYILVLADDRTEISRVQRMRNDFVANVSHELKTPVGAVSLLAEAIEQASDDPEAIEYFVGRLHKETRRLSALVRDIIELSRLQSTDVIARGGPVSVPTLVADAMDRSHLAAEEKDLQVPAALRTPPRCTATPSFWVWPCRTWWRTRFATRPNIRRWTFWCTAWPISCSLRCRIRAWVFPRMSRSASSSVFTGWTRLARVRPAARAWA